MCQANSQPLQLKDQLKDTPIDFNQLHINASKPESAANKVMCNQWDNGRCYHLNPDHKYNQENQSFNDNLVWVKFKTDQQVSTVEILLGGFGFNYHLQKDDRKSFIINPEGISGE